MIVQGALLVVAAAFAVISGRNDGGALLAIGVSVRSVRPLPGLLLLVAAVVTAPILFGVGVATTLTDGLVPFRGEQAQLAVLVAVIAAIGVTYALSRRGLPTSLTLALVGAIAGTGTGAGLAVAWSRLAGVLLLAILAPLAGAAIAWTLTVLAAHARGGGTLQRRVRAWHVVSFTAQCLAYGANDGQKMLAVVGLAVGTSGTDLSPRPWQLALIGTGFLLGAAFGAPSYARTLGTGVLPTRPPDVVLTEASSATAVFATAALGSPVSMVQTVTGSLVGTGVTRGAGRVRWRTAARILAAWALTTPAAFVAAALLALALTAATT